MENKITNNYSTANSLENSSANTIDKPLSPILNKKRFSRKALIDKKVSRRNQSLKELPNVEERTKPLEHEKLNLEKRVSSIPVPIKGTSEFKHPGDYNMKKIEDKNISDFKNEIIAKASNFSKHTSSGFETATGRSISISESKIKKYTELFADILTETNIEKEPHEKNNKGRRYFKQPQVIDYKCGSGDISEENVEDKKVYNPSNLNMIYENKQFSTIPISKTTFSGSVEDIQSVNTVHAGAVRVFNNRHFLSTDSSKDSVIRDVHFTQESTNTGITDAELLMAMNNIEDEYNENYIGSKKIPISQLNYNLATDDSNTTLECEIKGLEKLLEQKLDQSTRKECEKALVLCSNDSYLSVLSQDIKEILSKQKTKKKKCEIDTHPKSSKNSVFVNISPSTVSNFNFPNEFFKENKKYKGIVKTLKSVNKQDEYTGFAVEDIEQAAKMYEEYKSLVAQVEMETTYLEHIQRDKRKKYKDGIGKKCKLKKASESSKITDASDSTIYSPKKVQINSKVTVDSRDQGDYTISDVKCEQKKEHSIDQNVSMEVSFDKNRKSPRKSKIIDKDTTIYNSSTNTENNTISLPSNNRVQICIGNNRIKINIKSENGSNARSNFNEPDKEIKLVSIASETSSKKHNGQGLRKVSSNSIIPSSECTGFKLASGKEIRISNEMLKNAKKMFEENPLESEGKKHRENGTKKEPSSDIVIDKKNIRNQETKDKTYEMENEQENHVSCSGFKKVSGKEIMVSDEMKRKAEKLFAESDIKERSEATNDFKIPSEKPIQIAKDLYKHSDKVYEQTNKEISKEWNNSNISFSSCSGFKMASGKQIEISNELLENAEKMFEESIKEGENKDRKILKPKSVLKQKVHSRKALNFNDNTENRDPEKSFATAATNFTSSGFSSASGKALTISKEKFEMALNAFNNLDAEQSNINNECLTIVDPKDKCDSKILNNNSKMHEEVKYPSKTAHELIEDVVNTYDSAIEKVSASSTPLRRIQQSLCRSPSQRSIKSFSSKRRLGTSRYKPINIHKEKLEKAKHLFDDSDKSDDSFNSSSRNLNGFNSTPIKAERIPPETLTSTPIGKSCEMILDITPIKKSNDISERSCYKSSIIFHEKSCADLSQVQNEIDKEYSTLKKKLFILEGRMTALEQQKKILDSNDNSHRKQRLGVLLTKKQNTRERVKLEKLFISSEENINYFNIPDHIFAVTPKNAEKLHFNISNFNDNISVIKTIDGATVIPNSSNIVGVTEINNAFRAMEGVDPKLLHKSWVLNHYKLIVWKLASYERNFPQYFKDSLSIENIIAQLKYRYDREIDKAERSALRRILERDDIPQKRMILCVSDIILIGSNKFELDLTDGWYSIRTIIDAPLSQQILKNKIKVGTKLITQGAELLNCDGCHPLEVPDNVRLKINFNATRRALWHTTLGYYKIPMPFPVSLGNLHPDGGQISCLNFYIARVYPLRYLDNSDGIRILRNGKAEEKRAREFESERLKQMDAIKYKIINEMENNREEKINLENVDMKNIGNINCAKTLFAILQTSNDPEHIMNRLSSEQRNSVLEYKECMHNKRQSELSYKISKQIEELRVHKRNVVPLLKVLIMDINEDNRTYVFNIWKPTEEHMQIIKEESCISVFNVIVKKTGDLNTTNRTYFRPCKLSVSKKTQRQLLPIAMTVDSYYKPMFNEFDTVGLIVQITINNFDQELWLSDFVGRLLFVKIVDGPKLCSLLDNLKVGQTVALSNLVMHKCHNNFGQALANQFSLISQYPQQKFLQHGLDIFKEQLPNDIMKLLSDCEAKIKEIKSGTDLKNTTNCNNSSLQHFSNLSGLIDDSGEDSSIIPSRLTMTDVAMSLIDTDQFL